MKQPRQQNALGRAPQGASLSTRSMSMHALIPRKSLRPFATGTTSRQALQG